MSFPERVYSNLTLSGFRYSDNPESKPGCLDEYLSVKEHNAILAAEKEKSARLLAVINDIYECDINGWNKFKEKTFHELANEATR
jgi:hypothetical protein